MCKSLSKLLHKQNDIFGFNEAFPGAVNTFGDREGYLWIQLVMPKLF